MHPARQQVLCRAVPRSVEGWWQENLLHATWNTLTYATWNSTSLAAMTELLRCLLCVSKLFGAARELAVLGITRVLFELQIGRHLKALLDPAARDPMRDVQ